jgi:predicted RNA-binding protein with PIN domain
VAVARRDASGPHGHPPPLKLRPILGFRGRLAPRALATVRDVLDTDTAFRARVASEIDEVSVERATWLFLARPDGWEQEFDLLAEAASADAEREESARAEQTAARRVEHLEAALERQAADVARGVRDADEARAALEAERDRRRRSDDAARAAEAALAARDQERAETVRQLAEARALAEERLERIRALEAGEPSATPDGEAAWAGADPAEVAEALRQASRAAADLGEILDRATRALGPGRAGPAPVPPDRAASGAPSAGGRRRGPRRTALRLARGALEGSTEATDQVLRTGRVVVLVDGYNVSMSGWPTLDALTQRDRLVAMLSDVASRTGADIRVVFDGDDDGRRPAVSTPLAVRVHFTPDGVEADDVVLDMVDRVPVDRPVVVVSSDRRVQAGARVRGANVVASESLLAWVRR